MAQNVVINGVTYQNVPSVEIPKSGGGDSAEFYDTSDATLNNNNKMLSGNTAYAKGIKYTGSIVTNTGSNLSASGATVTVPAGYYAQQYTKDVDAGSATPQASISGTSATISTSSNTITLTKSVSNTPVVSPGYVASGTSGTSTVSLSASVTINAGATITPGTSDQTAAVSGSYLTGAITVQGDADLIPANIKFGKDIFGVVGTLSEVVVSQDAVTKILSIS